jgi:putative tryptophan/tyrosine transport system substrate-binding protein
MARGQRAYWLSRRIFCWTLAGVFVAPGIAIAQASKIRRIGVLEPGAPELDTPEWRRRQAEPLEKLGWVEGQNLLVERRYANGRPEALQPLAEELVRAKVEIIVTAGTPDTLAAMHATSTIPIVFRTAGNPVLLGLVASLARPGGNVTGYTEVVSEVTAKQLSVLKELLPRVQRIGVLWEAGNPYIRAIRGQFERVCQSLGLVPIIVEIGAADEADGVIAQLVRQRAQALVMSSGLGWEHDNLEGAIGVATKHSLPTMSDDSEIARAGALMTYGATWIEQHRRRAEYIDRILRGAKPADLPVQQPTNFELVINLKTAKALGLTIPKELLLRADEVIQ